LRLKIIALTVLWGGLLAGSLQASTADIANSIAPGATAIAGVGFLGIGSLARRSKKSS